MADFDPWAFGASALGTAGGLFGNILGFMQNQRNLQFQYDNLEYQKALQEKIFDREDTSYQRTINDMRKAGLSPLAMNGTNNAGSAIPTTAPVSNFVPETTSFNNAMTTIANMKSIINESKRVEAEVSKSNAETEAQLINNKYAESQILTTLASMREDMNLSRTQRNLINTQITGYLLDNQDKGLRLKYADDLYKYQAMNSEYNAKQLKERFDSFYQNKKAEKDFWKTLGVNPHLNDTTKDLILDVLGSTGFNLGLSNKYTDNASYLFLNNNLKNLSNSSNLTNLVANGALFGLTTIPSVISTLIQNQSKKKR